MYIEENKWQRQDDARTLARAKEITSDTKRYREAQIGAKEILDMEKSRTKALESIARGSARKSNKATVSKDIFTNFKY